MELTRETIAARLIDYAGLSVQDPYPDGFFTQAPRRAAVLIALFHEQRAWRLLFIRRAQVPGDRHSGEVAFPGGRLEAQDAGPDAAALREAREEVGLHPARVCVLGHLPDYRTVSNFLVTPVVAEIAWPASLRPAPAEVSHIFSIPMPWLADPHNRRIQRKYLSNPGLALPVIYFRPDQGEQLWGVSARITLSLLQVLGLTAAEPGRGP